jgi:hypothetical protein
VFDDLPCSLILAEDLDAAFARLRDHIPDLVICDYPSLEPIRDLSPQVKIIVLAREAPPYKIIAAIDEKAYAYFSPPFDPSNVREMVLEALERPDLTDGILMVSRDPKFLSVRLRCRINTADRLLRFFTQMRSDIGREERAQIAMALRDSIRTNGFAFPGFVPTAPLCTMCRIRDRGSHGVIWSMQRCQIQRTTRLSIWWFVWRRECVLAGLECSWPSNWLMKFSITNKAMK